MAIGEIELDFDILRAVSAHIFESSFGPDLLAGLEGCFGVAIGVFQPDFFDDEVGADGIGIDRRIGTGA